MIRHTSSYKVECGTIFKQKLLRWSTPFDTVIYLDDNNHKQKHSSFDAIIAVDAHKQIRSSYHNAFETCKKFYNQTLDWIFGYFSYDLKNDIEPLKSENLDVLQYPELFLFQPKRLIFIKNNNIRFSYLNYSKNDIDTDFHAINQTPIYKTKELITQKINIHSRLSKDCYFKIFEKIENHILRGNVYEINFCTEFYAEARIYPQKVFSKLNRLSEAPFSAFMKLDHLYAMCASPERFIKKQGDTIISQPIKGTFRRGATTETDNHIKDILDRIPKERSENIMTVDLVRNDLSKISQKGTVAVDELCHVSTFAQIHHLISTVSSKLIKNIHPVDVIKMMFPMASMTGVPKLKAMEIIEDLETSKRGLYSGALGYFSPNGDFDFNVVIRSLLYNETNRYLSLSAGGAITSRSVKEKEYEEILLKIKNIKECLN